MRERAKKLSRHVTTSDASLSEPGDSGDEASPPGLRIVSVPDLTEDALRRSGIKRSMRVLDLQCGTGEASLLIARLTGYCGLVVGVDRSAEAVDAAERRATLAGCCYWTRFVTADPTAFVPHGRFDAAVVRLPLLRQVKRVTFLRLSDCVRPGGILLVLGKPAGDVDSILHRFGSRLS
nr:methyltransferase domain-containing protein [Bradyrhizobium lablabi]